MKAKKKKKKRLLSFLLSLRQLVKHDYSKLTTLSILSGICRCVYITGCKKVPWDFNWPCKDIEQIVAYKKILASAYIPLDIIC